MGAAAVTSASTSFFYSNVGTRTTQKTSIQATHLISRHVSTSVTNMMEQSIKNSSWKQYKRLHSTEAAKATTNTTSSATTSTPKQSKGFLQWYEGHLQARPVATKAVTGSILWGLGVSYVLYLGLFLLFPFFFSKFILSPHHLPLIIPIYLN
jgi:hypothetical protein